MSSCDNFFGNKGVKEHLLSLIKNVSLPNVILLSGKKGIGKATLSYRICQVLLQNVVGVSEGLHENLLVCSSKDGSVLTLDSVARIRSFIATKAISCSSVVSGSTFIDNFKNNKYLNKKVVIIDAIDDMNIQSQNALLKTFEESLNVIFILISHQSSKVIFPVLSRCSKFLLQPLSDGELSCVLQGIYSVDEYQKLEKFVSIAGGSVDLIGVLFDFYDRYFEMLGIFKQSLLLSTKQGSDDLGSSIFEFTNKVVLGDLYCSFIKCYNNFWARMFYYLISHEGYLLPEEKEISSLFSSNQVRNFYFNYWVKSRGVLQSSVDLNTNKSVIITCVLGKLLN